MLNACRVESPPAGRGLFQELSGILWQKIGILFYGQVTTLCVISAFSKGGKDGKKRHISAHSLSLSISQDGLGPAPEFSRIAACRGETFAAALIRRRERYLIESSAPEHPP
ncbi:MAG: hypothetical protein K0S36_553 [Nitrosospira multiformis]|nr:hypothetical protein [Nitrosospira multiformis]